MVPAFRKKKLLCYGVIEYSQIDGKAQENRKRDSIESNDFYPHFEAAHSVLTVFHIYSTVSHVMIHEMTADEQRVFVSAGNPLQIPMQNL